MGAHREPSAGGLAPEARWRSLPRKYARALRVPLLVVGPPLFVLLGIREYWSARYHSGEVELYHVGAMVMLRGMLLIPLQLLVSGLLLGLFTRRALRVRWWLVLGTTLLAWPLGRWLEATLWTSSLNEGFRDYAAPTLLSTLLVALCLALARRPEPVTGGRAEPAAD